ncbi:hypothetical protein TCAL_04830 [Tigriopus californicus]|uniref:Down syndrome cell adhesion molecule-like protein Dscam2 n=1 Tax=Tigriopus californicus TaxID=6832 RepID=A0A553NZ92_TIGCA|nr:hypothetical protein TCAL_04830 [Tigriopus californicus]
MVWREGKGSHLKTTRCSRSKSPEEMVVSGRDDPKRGPYWNGPRAKTEVSRIKHGSISIPKRESYLGLEWVHPGRISLVAKGWKSNFMILFLAFFVAPVVVIPMGVNAVPKLHFIEEPSQDVRFSKSTGISIRCVAVGDPDPTLEWRVLPSGSALTSAQLASALLSLSEDNTTLTFHPFSAERYSSQIHAQRFQCAATSSNVGTIVSAPVNVRAVVDQDYELQVYPSYAYLGNTAVVKCLMPPYVKEFLEVSTWMWGSELITSDIEQGGRFSVFPDGELHIRNVTTRDGSESFRCLAKHKLTGVKTASSIAGRLTVQNILEAGTIPVRIPSTRSHIRAKVGTTAELPCVGIGLPVPKYTWFRNGHQIFPDPQRGMKMFSGSLLLSNVSEEDHGAWTCRVENPLGSEETTITLHVYSDVRVLIQPERQRVDVGIEARLLCAVEGFPLSSITWLRNGLPLPPRRMDSSSNAIRTPIQISGDKKALLIKSVARKDRGMYQCFVGANPLGTPYEERGLAGDWEIFAHASALLELGDSIPVVLPTFHERVIEPGRPLTLECSATGTPRPNIRWLLDGTPLTFDTSASFSLTLTNETSSRARLSLRISRMRLDQGGFYKCEASNYLGHATRAKRVDVYGPPYVRPMEERSVVAEADAWFHCPYSGYPIQRISWSKDGEPLPTNERQALFANGSLRINHVVRNDAGHYVCEAFNSKGERAKSKLEVKVMVAPRIEPFQFKSGLQERGRTRVVCTTSLGDLPISFAWYFNDEPLTQSNDEGISINTFDDFTSSLSFPNLRTTHSGNYTCVAKNAAAKAYHSATLMVNIPPKWMAFPLDQNVMLGSPVSLDCKVTGIPPPSITWSKSIEDSQTTGDGSRAKFQDIYTIMSNFRVHPNGTLMLSDATAENEGKYLCKADNGVGEPVSKLAELTINVPATFAVTLENQSITVGTKSAAIECPVSGDNPITVEWTRNGMPILLSDPRMKIKEEPLSNGLLSKLVLPKVRREDTASFVCSASNAFGSSQRIVHLIVQEPPEVPIGLSVVSFSSRTVNLTWIPPYDGRSPITAYLVEYKKAFRPWNEAESHTCSGLSDWTELHTLKPASLYHLRLIGINAIGRSNPTPPIVISTKEEAPEGPPNNVAGQANGSQALFVTWEPPDTNLQHGEILGYYLGYKVTNSSDPYRYQTLEITKFEDFGIEHHKARKLELHITHLKKYTQYSIVVQAYNRMGAGPKHHEIILSTDEDVPSSPPRSVQCTALSSTSLLIMWSPPPVKDMNGKLQEYRVAYRPLREWEEQVEIHEQSTMQQQITLYGLEKYQNYSVQVVASTHVGQGLKSRSIYCRTKEDVPSSPANIKAIASDQNTVLISWIPPEYPNGDLTHYSVFMKTMESGRQFTQHFEVYPPNTMFSVRGLNQNQPYSFWVTASTLPGEGPESEIVAETPQTPLPASIASFSQKVTHALKEEVRLFCTSVGQPKPINSWSFNERELLPNPRIRLESSNTVLRILAVQMNDVGNYSCSAQNHFGQDQITYQLVVKLSRNNGVPPAPPKLNVLDTSSNSIILGWMPSADGGSPLLAYNLHYHCEFGDWDRVEVHPDTLNYTFRSLKCGANYQFYIQAVNDFGVGERTETISAYTLGEAPIPPRTKSLIAANSTYIALNLSSWLNGGCPISSFVVEYRKQIDVLLYRGKTEWHLVNNNVRSDIKEFLILDLSPETKYELKITAHNAAGSTVEEYDFTTLTFSGATVAPELVIHSEYSGLFFTNPAVIIPLFLTIVIVAVVMTLLIHHFRKNIMSEAPGMKCHQRSQLLGDDGSHQCMPSLPHPQNEGGGGGGGGGPGGSAVEGAYNAISYSNYPATSTFGTTTVNGNGRTGRRARGSMHSKSPPQPMADESYQAQMIMNTLRRQQLYHQQFESRSNDLSNDPYQRPPNNNTLTRLNNLQHVERHPLPSQDLQPQYFNNAYGHDAISQSNLDSVDPSSVESEPSVALMDMNNSSWIPMQSLYSAHKL